MIAIELFTLGLQVPKLQKPLVFIAMLVGFIAFSLFIYRRGIFAFVDDSESSPANHGLETLGLGLFFFVLAALCGYFTKRCFDN